MVKRRLSIVVGAAAVLFLQLSLSADTSYSREEAFEVGAWSQSRLNSEVERLKCMFGDQFDDVLDCLTSNPNPPAGMVTVGTLRTKPGLGGVRPANHVYRGLTDHNSVGIAHQIGANHRVTPRERTATLAHELEHLRGIKAAGQGGGDPDVPDPGTNSGSDVENVCAHAKMMSNMGSSLLQQWWGGGAPPGSDPEACVGALGLDAGGGTALNAMLEEVCKMAQDIADAAGSLNNQCSSTTGSSIRDDVIEHNSSQEELDELNHLRSDCCKSFGTGE